MTTGAVTRSIIHDEGDVFLKCGSKELLVHSKVLSLGSPVFKAMLGPQFREGNVPRSPSNPLNLELPEDQPQALVVLCWLLHHTKKEMNTEHDGALLVELVRLADKYDCVHVVWRSCREWLRSVDEEEATADELWKAATVGFMVDDEQEFEKATTQLIKRWPKEQEECSSYLNFPFSRALEGIFEMSYFLSFWRT